MATPQLVTVRDFTTSPYGQLVDNLDTPINDILVRAESAVTSFLQTPIVPTTTTETWRSNGQVLFVRHRPIISVASIRRRPSTLSSWETIASTDYYIEPEPGYIESYAVVKGYFVEATYTYGWATVPPIIQQAVIMTAVTLSYQDLEFYGSGDSRSPGVLYVRDDVRDMLMPFKQNPSVWH